MAKAMGPLPSGAKAIRMQDRTRLYQLVGDTWIFYGDALQVFTTANYKIHYNNFRKALMKLAGSPAYKKTDVLHEYIREMIQGLERGFVEVVKWRLRRVVMSVCGLRSSKLQWEEAERIAVRGMCYASQATYIKSELKEVMVFTAASLQADSPVWEKTVEPKVEKGKLSSEEAVQSWNLCEYESPDPVKISLNERM